MIALATQHQKEKVIIPVLGPIFKDEIIVPENFNSDEFGTFDGRINRTLSAKETVKMKCLAGMKRLGTTKGIASEGSFGPHPSIPFLPFNEEWIIYIDQEQELEIYGKYVSTETNYWEGEIKDLETLKSTAEKLGFPEHNLILSVQKPDGRELHKDFTTWESLLRRGEALISEHSLLLLQTDMRAMHNPTRMKNIGKAAEDLKTNYESQCPSCRKRGYAITDTKPGLPCSQCELPSKTTARVIYTCANCQFTEELGRPDGITSIDPQYCDFCNP